MAFAPALMVILFSVLVYGSVQRALASAQEVERGYRVSSALDTILARVQDAETAQRGYVLVGDPAYLEPLHSVRDDVGRAFDSLRALMTHPTQLERLEGLRPVLEQRLALVERHVALRRAGETEWAVEGIRSGEGKALMDEIRARMHQLQEAQRVLLAERNAREHQRAHLVMGVLLGGTAITVFLALLVNGLLVRYAAHQEKTADELEQQNIQLEEQAVELEAQTAEMQAQAIDLEEALDSIRANEEIFRALIENASDLIAILDADGGVRYHSPAVERSLGYSEGALIGENLFDRVHPDDRPHIEREFGQILAEPQATFSLECRLRHRDDSWRVLVVSGRNLLETPALEGVVINAQDVSESKRLESQLHHAQRMEAIGRLAGGIAHDFNNVLAIIKGNVQMLQLDVAPGDPLVDELALIDEAVARAASLSRQLLAFSRKQLLEPRVLDLNDLVSETSRMLRRIIGADVELVTALARDLAPIKADPGQIEQVLMNLAVNARDALPRGGRLVIETRNALMGEVGEHFYPHLPAGSPAVLLSVSDTGQGMDRATQERIFEPFFTTKAPGEGTGLGLSTVYGIVKQSGGYIWVYSEPGQGTTFKIYFPRVHAPLDPEPLATPLDGIPQGSGTVLLAEDDAQLREVVRKMLSRGGYSVLEAANGEEALRLCREQGEAIDLLVTDMVMPLMNGWELAGRVAQFEREIPVLFMSGYTDEAVLRGGDLAAGSAILQKPFAAQHLLQKVALLIRESART